MSIVKAATNTYGPATLDIQIEQGCDFSLTLTLTQNGVTWDLTGATFVAELSTAWQPGGTTITMTATSAAPTTGVVTISLPAASTANLALPQPQATTPNALLLNTPPSTRQASPRWVRLGGWCLQVTQGGTTVRLIEGDVTLDRDPTED